MVSFDVVSLFTKVPIDAALDTISDLLQRDENLVKHTPQPLSHKPGIVYEIPCKDCEHVYTYSENRISEHKSAVKRRDKNNGIAVHEWSSQHMVNWEAAKLKEVERHLWRRKTLEAIYIFRSLQTSNLDNGVS